MVRLWLIFSLIAMIAAPAGAAVLRVAVAANFNAPLQELAAAFKAAHGHDLRISVGATGALTAQIQRGAPFDVFLAADTVRPGQLVAEGLAREPVPYAIGRLVLIARAPIDATAPSLATVRTLSIANPRTAPYGAAAKAAMTKLMPSESLRIAQAQSVAGVMAAVVTGAADAGLGALSSVADGAPDGLSVWTIPADWHPALRQDAVVLHRARDPEVAQLFVDWLTKAEARQIIERFGYTAP